MTLCFAYADDDDDLQTGLKIIGVVVVVELPQAPEDDPQKR